MKEVLVVILTTSLLLMATILPVFAAGEVPPNVQISEEEMEEAKPAGDAIEAVDTEAEIDKVKGAELLDIENRIQQCKHDLEELADSD